jgi:molybdopterin molybdotransferase
LSLVSAPLAFESIPLTFCVGRVLAETFEARLKLPGFDQSAVDGYALCSADMMPGAGSLRPYAIKPGLEGNYD